MPSFDGDYERTSGGQTFANPYPNYGNYGNHLEDYFYHGMRETPAGGTDKLAVYLNTQAGMTTMVASGLTGLRNHIYTRFGATADTTGYGLLDFRGSTSWNIITGDGIIGPSNVGSTAFIDTSTAATQILDYLSDNTQIKWAYAGLPYLPHVTTYAPNGGSAHSWNTGLTNTGITATNHWDNDHPTGGSLFNMVYMWYSTAPDLKDYYKAKSVDSVTSILDSSGWLCPDINPIDTQYGVSKNWYSIEQAASYTEDIMERCSVYSDQRLESDPYNPIEVFPLLNTMYRSRNGGIYDDPTGKYTMANWIGINDSNNDPSTAVHVYSGYTGTTGYSCETLINEAMFKGGMIQPAARNLCAGFVYFDQIPFMIELACTAGITNDAAQIAAQNRSRYFLYRDICGQLSRITTTSNIETRLFRQIEDCLSVVPGLTSLFGPHYGLTSGLTGVTGYDKPWSYIQDAVRYVVSYDISSNYLRYISESIPVGDPNWNSIVAPVGDGSSDGVTGYTSLRWNNNGNQSSFVYGNETASQNCCIPPTTEICCRTSTSACGTCEVVEAGTCSDGTVVTDCAECTDPYNISGVCCINDSCSSMLRCDCEAAGGTFFTSVSGCEASGCGNGGGNSGDTGTSGGDVIPPACPDACNIYDCFHVVDSWTCSSLPCDDGTYTNGFSCVKIGRRPDTTDNSCCSTESTCLYNCKETCNLVVDSSCCSETQTKFPSTDSLCDTSVIDPCAANQTYECCGDSQADCPTTCTSAIGACNDGGGGGGGGGNPTSPISEGNLVGGETLTLPVSVKTFLESSIVSNEAKKAVVQTITGLVGYKAIADLEKINFTGTDFPIDIREIAAVTDNIDYYSTLPINNEYLTTELNFRENSPANSNTINRIQVQNSNDVFLVKYTYIP